LYPLLKRLERNGWLRSEAAVGEGKRRRRYYHLTKRGATVLEVLRETVVELHHEIVEEAPSHIPHTSVRLSPMPSPQTDADTSPPRRRAPLDQAKR
jgi:DNA-binding PadR family transcriptional regulator